MKFCRRHPTIPTVFIAALITIVIFFSSFFVKDLLEFRALQKIVEINYDECQNLLLNQNQLINRTKVKIHSKDSNFILATTKNSIPIIVNNANFKDASAQLIDALNRIHSLTYEFKYYDMTKKVVELLIKYHINANALGSLKTLLSNTAHRDIKRAVEEILQTNPDLEKEIYLLENSLGSLNISGDKIEKIRVKYYSENNPSEVTDNFNYKLPFSDDVKVGIYILEYLNNDNKLISIPINIGVGEVVNFEIPEVNNVPNNMIYIHEGKYYSNIQQTYELGLQRYIDSFFISQTEVTFKEYLEFWNSIKDPILKARYKGYKIDNQDTLEIISLWDKNGKLIAPLTEEMPVFGLSIEAMNSFCQYIGDKSKMKCRLPYWGEIEKAARSVDRRLYVWGNNFENSFCLTSENPNKKSYPYGAKVGTFEYDSSLYGVKDLSGNLREVVQVSGDELSYGVYGGSYLTNRNNAKCSSINKFIGFANDIGFRYVIEIDESKK